MRFILWALVIVSFVFILVTFILRRTESNGDSANRLLEKMRELESKSELLEKQINQLDEQIAVNEYLQLKKKVGRIVHGGRIAEVVFTFKDKERIYVLTGFADCVSFKRFSIENFYYESMPCVDGDEVKFKYMDDLFENDLIDGINLKRDWKKISRCKICKGRKIENS